jgi:hypothetical protein
VFARETPVLIQRSGQREVKEVLFQNGEVDHYLTSKRVISYYLSRSHRWLGWLGLGKIRYFLYEQTGTNSGTGIRRKGGTHVHEVSKDPEEIYSGDEIIIGTLDDRTHKTYTFLVERKSR